jgi:hypothetical protein
VTGMIKSTKFEDEGIFGSLVNWFHRRKVGMMSRPTLCFSLLLSLLVRFTIVELLGSSESRCTLRSVGDQLAVEKVTKRLETFYRNEVVVFNPPQTFRDIHMRQHLKESAHQARSSGRRRSRSQGRKVLYQRRGTR